MLLGTRARLKIIHISLTCVKHHLTLFLNDESELEIWIKRGPF